MDQAAKDLLSPVLQFGAFGLCGLLIVALMYCFKKMFDVLKENTVVLSKTSDILDELRNDMKSGIATMIDKVDDGFGSTNSAIDRLERRMLSRPCIAKKED